jgi:hypothetical protein
MGFRATNALQRLYAALLGIVLSCLATGTTFAQRGQPIEFSSPQSGVMVSNLNQLRAKQSGQKQLEEDLSRPFESFNPDNSLGPVFTAPYRPPTRPRIPTKQEKERDDLRKNWVFMNPDDLSKGPSPEKIFGLKDYDKNGEEKKSLTAAEKYFQNLERKRGAANDGTDDPGINEDKNAFSSFRSTDRLDTLGENADKPDQLLRGILNSDLDSKLGDGSTTFSGSPFSDQVKAGGFQTDRDSTREVRMKEFNQLMESTATPSITAPSLTPAYSDPTRRDLAISALGGLNPGAPSTLGVLQDANTRTLGLPSWTPPVQPSPLLKAQKQQNFTFPTRPF